MLDLEAAIDSYDVSSDHGITKAGMYVQVLTLLLKTVVTAKGQTRNISTEIFFCLSFIYELLERAHLTYSSKTAVHEALEQISGYLAGREYDLTFFNHI